MAEFPSDAKPDEALPSQESSIYGSLPDVYSLQRMLDAQRDRIHQQMDELQRVVVLQCQITGTNPLAEEMAAAVLGTRTGRRCGESLTPKAVKCLYNVFSIKDTITKKEAREISALCGATVTQVREFFSEQRSRVRKLVQLSHEEVGNQSFLFGIEPLKQNFSNCSEVQDHQGVQLKDQERPHSSLLDGVLESIIKGLNKSNVETAENLIDVMRKENTFIGQIQVAQVILQAHQGPILRRFMAKGGLQQIIKWLVQAAAEEQTSLIRVLLKAVAHLPLGSAFPRQMSSLLQIVNKLRFYRAQDVASRARLLLSRWSRFFKSTLNARILSSTGSTGTLQAIQKRNRDVTVLHMEGAVLKKRSKLCSMVDFSGPSSEVASSSSVAHANNLRRLQVGNPSQLELTSTKKRPANSLLQADRVKERRKVQLFEEARVRVRRRKNAAMVKTSGFDLAPRPLSADDIKKAKRRAHLLQSPSIPKTQKSSNWQSDMSSSSDGLPYTSSTKQSFGDVAYPGFGEDSNLSGLLAKTDEENVKLTLKDEKRPLLVDTISEQAQEYLPEIVSKYRNERVVLKKNVKLEPSQQKAAHCHCATSTVMLEAAHSCMQGHKEKRNEGSLDVLIASKRMLLNVKEDSELIDGCSTVVDPMGFNIIQWTVPPKMVLDPRWRVATGEESRESSNQTLRLKDEQEVLYVSAECIPSNPHEPLERVSLFVDDALVPEISLEAVGEDSQDLESPLQSPTKPDEVRLGLDEADSKFAFPVDTTREFVCQELCQIGEATTSRFACTDTGRAKPNESEDTMTPVLSLALNAVSLELASQSKLDSSGFCTTMESSKGEQRKKDSEVPNLTGMSTAPIFKQSLVGILDQSLKVCSTSHMALETEQDKGMPFTKLEAEHTVSAGSHQASSAALVDKVSSAFQVVKSYSVRLKEKHNETKPVRASNNDTAVEEHEHDMKLGLEVVKEVFPEQKDEATPILARACTAPMADCLPILTGEMVASSSTVQQNGGFSNQSLSSSLNVSVPLHQGSKFQDQTNGHTVPDVLGFNLSELSKEDCLDMLKMVLGQLADNTSGSGADLELLSVFLKNPDLVYALTSSEALSSCRDFILANDPPTNSIKGFSAINASETCNVNSSHSEKLLGPNMLNPKPLLKTTGELREKVALGIQTSLPFLAEQPHVRPPSSESAVAMQQRPPLPPMPPPLPSCMRVMDQAVRVMDQATQLQYFQKRLLTSTHFLQQSSAQAPERNTYVISGEVASNDTARDWSQRGHGLLHAGSKESAGFVAKPSMESSTPQRPSLDQCSMFPDSFQPRPGITTASLMNSSNQPVSSQQEGEAANLVLPTIRTDARGQPPAFLQDHHCQVNPTVSKVERREVQVNGRNGSSFATITNAVLDANIKGRELGPSVGILRAAASDTSNERLQQPGVMPVDKLTALMPDTRGGQIVTQFIGKTVPPKSTFVKPVPEHILGPPLLLHPILPSAKPPLLPVCAPPFASVPSTPQGNVMGWQPTAAQSRLQSYLRPGWRGQ